MGHPGVLRRPTEHLVLWVSAPDSRHSRNIAEQPTIAITIFDSHAPIGGAEAPYLEATATRIQPKPPEPERPFAHLVNPKA